MKKATSKLFKRTVASLMCILLMASIIVPASAEGSRDLIKNGGYRPYIEWDQVQISATIPRTTILNVMAYAGETIYFGSSVPASFDGKDIIVTSPSGEETIYDVLNTGEGLINTNLKETTGPNIGTTETANGYTPLSLTVNQTGIWSVIFHSPLGNGTGKNPKAQLVTAPIDTAATQAGGISAWDISVFDRNSRYIPGRVFTKYVAMNTGLNAAGTDILNSDFYIQTVDGYVYKYEMNGADPWGFIFFANNRGLIDAKSSETLYHSTKTTTIDAGHVLPQYPYATDTTTNVTHNIFFNKPSNTLPSSMPITPQASASCDDLRFDGIARNRALQGAGGIIKFESDKLASYTIRLRFKNSQYKDIIANGTSSIGTNTFAWNGKDANGVVVPAGEVLNAHVHMSAGEYHAPLFDVETNKNGIKSTLTNPPADKPASFDATLVHYNFDSYTTASGYKETFPITGRPELINAVEGVSSFNGALSFGTNFGNNLAIDMWQYYPQGEFEIDADIVVEAGQGNFGYISGSVFLDANTDAKWNPGESYLPEVPVRITDNNGTVYDIVTDAFGKYTASIPYGAYTVEILPRNGYEFSTSSAPKTGTLSADKAVVADTGLKTTVECATTVSVDKDLVTEGDELTFTVTATNNGEYVSATNIQVYAPLPANTTYVSDTSGGTYDASTGYWRFDSLTPGETKTITIKAVAADEGSYTFSSKISTLEKDSYPANNTSSVSYSVSAGYDLSVKLRKTSTGIKKIGEESTFTLTLKNETEYPMTGVNVTVPAPNYASYSSKVENFVNDTGIWTIGDLGPNEVKTIELSLKSAKGGNYTLVATAAGNEIEGMMLNNVSEADYSVEVVEDKPITQDFGLTNDYAYIYGYSDTEMGPEKPMLRGEASAVIHRLLKQNDKLRGYTKPTVSCHGDVATTDWYFTAVEFATYIGVFKAEGDFGPRDAIARSTAARLFCKALDIDGTNLPANTKFFDVGAWHPDFEWIKTICAYGVMSVDTKGNFRPYNSITRAEFCESYNKIIKRDNTYSVNKKVDGSTYTTPFKDLDSSKWYFNDMVRASNSYTDKKIDLSKRQNRNALDEYTPVKK